VGERLVINFSLVGAKNPRERVLGYGRLIKMRVVYAALPSQFGVIEVQRVGDLVTCLKPGA